jgi:hypothetical protein
MDTNQGIEIAAQQASDDDTGAQSFAALNELELVMVGGGIGNTIL